MSNDSSSMFAARLEAAAAGDELAQAEIAKQIEDELRLEAFRLLAREKGQNSWKPSDLAQQTWLKLLGDKFPAAENRRHLLNIATRAMRQVLVEYSRRKKAERRGGARKKVEIDVDQLDSTDIKQELDYEAMDEALRRLESIDPRRAEVVHLKYFAGYTIPEIAEIMGISAKTVSNCWKKARLWLKAEISDE